MTGTYVRWYGQLARITEEGFGFATIKLLKRKRYHRVLLTQLKPVATQTLKT